MAHQSQGPSRFTVWDDLTDPTSDAPFPVQVTEDALVHIGRGHVLADSESNLWRELLDPDLVDRFGRWLADRRTEPPPLEEVAAKLKPQVADGLRHPCCADYQQKYDAGDDPHGTREIITWCGLVVVIRRLPDANVLRTAFFPRGTWAEKPQRRWRAALRSRVELFTNVVTVEGKKLIVHPNPDDTFGSDDPPGHRTDVRFVTPETWGFRQVEIDGEKMRVWKSPLPWSAPPAVPSGILKKRKASSE